MTKKKVSRAATHKSPKKIKKQLVLPTEERIKRFKEEEVKRLTKRQIERFTEEEIKLLVKEKSHFLTKKQVARCAEILLLRDKEEILNKTLMKPDLSTDQDDRSDEADLASSEVEKSMSARLGNREKLYLRKVDQALARIKENTYGECVECGELIDSLRLIARTTAELCIACKEEQENREKLSVHRNHHKSLGQSALNDRR